MSRRPGIPLGRLAGVPVFLAPSWFAVAAVVVVIFAPQVQGSVAVSALGSYLVAAVYAVLLLVSVLVHEFAHALTARAMGLPVQQVVADLWGGHTQFTDEAPSPGRSALVAVVGPLANGALALLGFAVLPGIGHGVLRLLVVALVFTNAFVAVFNLAPGLPLDGGRVVESVVWAVTGRRWSGTLAAGWSGRVVTLAVIAWVVLLPIAQGRLPTTFSLVWGALIAMLLWQGATGAIALGRLGRGAARLDLPRYTERAWAAPAAGEEWRAADPRATGHVVAVDSRGTPVGVLLAEDAARLLHSAAPPPPGTPLSAVMTVLDPVVLVGAEATGDEVLRLVAGSPVRMLVVVAPNGRVVGVADVGALASALTGRP